MSRAPPSSAIRSTLPSSSYHPVQKEPTPSSGLVASSLSSPTTSITCSTTPNPSPVSNRSKLMWTTRTCGVFYRWCDTLVSVAGFPDSAFKGFDSRQEAELAFAKGRPICDGEGLQLQGFDTAEKFRRFRLNLVPCSFSIMLCRPSAPPTTRPRHLYVICANNSVWCELVARFLGHAPKLREVFCVRYHEKSRAFQTKTSQRWNNHP